jgi:hypothetical protein
MSTLKDEGLSDIPQPQPPGPTLVRMAQGQRRHDRRRGLSRRARSPSVEHYFHDSGIEESRRTFHAAVTEFTLQLSQYSGPSDHGAHFELNEKQWTRSHPFGDETSRRYEAHRRKLSGLADKVVAAYNALVEEARRQVP